MSKVATYSPAEVDVIIGGYLMKGFSDSSMVTITPSNPKYSSVRGIDGEELRSRSYDDSAEMTLSLMRSSESNQVLTDLLKADLAAPNGSGVFDVRVVDKSGDDVFEASKAYITNWPDLSYEAEGGSNDWTIRLVDYDPNFGGTPDAAI